ncbi:uncharacterized protein 5PtaseI [Prorops nasuta]|uniref:uncharacterized protein 5PtaseI n=1 Tax=Prorops nasuta TaxID=863751 RepID=UPI0034CE81B8
MTSSGVPVLLITANVGSIFEEPSVMLKIWTEEFLSTISRLDPKFIALHCQEVGGKNYEQSMRHVEDFVRLLMSSEELRLFDKVRVFLDEDYSSAEHFTALGNFYFVHESLKEVLLWDFKECTFVPVTGKEVHSGNIEAVSTKEKAKFPQDFFPECKWSRKGFLRTRWSIRGTVFDLINIHLFHDASNFIAMETFPSVYSKTRRRALEHTLDRFHNDKYPNAPYFLFGDFNFRTDTSGVIKKLTEDTQEKKLSSKGNISKLQFRNKEDDLILTLGKKEFSHCEHQNVFMQNSGEWLREYDKELEDFDGRLFEFPINFVPSYPFEEDVNEATNYMQTRVPAWCDRVLLSPAAKTLVQSISSSNAVEYGIIGPATCMGDHKPVYLRAIIDSDAGMINCCSLPTAAEFCFRVPDNYLDVLSMLPDCNSARPLCVSSNLLHAAPVKHDPYTPDSMDSPSPNAVPAPEEHPDNQNDESDLIFVSTNVSNVRRVDNRAVSPALLKSKLELIARNEKREQAEQINSRDLEIKRSPSEYKLHTWSDNEERTWDLRKNRSNSDVSWQRSQVLTRAWLQGKGQQGYHSFNEFHRSSSSSSPSPSPGDVVDLVIPRIAIINASNFESNESSVYLHDDKHSNYSENRLSAYSDGQTKTLNGDSSSFEKSDNTSNKTQEECENIILSTELEHEQNQGISQEETTRLIDERKDTNDKFIGVQSKFLTNISDVRHFPIIGDKCIEQNLFETKLNNSRIDIQYQQHQTCDSNVINVESDSTRLSCSDTEIFKADSKISEVSASRNLTRSNSIQSQDTSENTGNVKLRIKAFKVTERCKNNIVGKKRRCQKCCCSVS